MCSKWQWNDSTKSHTHSLIGNQSTLYETHWEMHQTRLKDYKRGWKNYRCLNPYFRIKKRLERLPKGRRREWRYPDPQSMVYAEVDNTDFNKRYKYTTFAKSQDRRMFKAMPRKIAFLYGNEFLLKDDNYRYPLPQLEDRLMPGQQILFKGLYDRVSDNLYNPRQLLPTGTGPILSEEEVSTEVSGVNYNDCEENDTEMEEMTVRASTDTSGSERAQEE